MRRLIEWVRKYAAKDERPMLAVPDHAKDAPRLDQRLVASPFLVVVTYESGRVTIAGVDDLEELGNLKQGALSGMSEVMSVTAFARLG